MKHPMDSPPENRAISEKKILAAVDHFTQTGEITDLLVSFFDQNGRWLGDRRSWRNPTYKISCIQMKMAVLPMSRRVTTSARGESVLCTSFVQSTNRLVVMPWHEVQGCIRIKGNASVAAPCLRIVGREIHATTTSEIDFPRLRRVKGDFDVIRTWKVHAPRLQSVGGSVRVMDFYLPQLVFVGGHLSIHMSKHILAPLLQKVGGTMHAHDAKSVHAPVLESVGHALIADRAQWFRAPNLRSVGSSLLLELATAINAERLRSVGAWLTTVSARDFYPRNLKVGTAWIAHPLAEDRWRVRCAARRILNSRPSFEI